MPCSSLYASWMRAPAVGLANRGPHRVGHRVSVHDDPAVDVAGGAAGRLDQRAGRSQEAFLVGVEDRDERHLRQVEPFAQQVDARPARRTRRGADRAGSPRARASRCPSADSGPGRPAPDSTASGPPPCAWSASSPARARAARRAPGSPASRSSTCPLTGPHLDRRIDQARRPDDLLDDDALRLRQLVRPRRRRHEDDLRRRAPPTPRSSAAGCRAPTAAGSRRRPALPCATGRRGTCRGSAARSGGSRPR